ncbi:MAG: sulfite exporter TauE/SafE family protein [Chloroflexi bacterium]|nr:sulfite exporter TauE/SafE family protein [Chloroflexota bacterium]
MLPELTAVQIVLLLTLGLSVGTLGATVGIGGGVLLVPVLLVVFPDASPAVITTISLTAVVMNAASANAGYRRKGWQDRRTGLVLAAAVVPGAIAGALLTRLTERGIFELIFGVALVVGSIYLAVRGRRLPQVTEPTETGSPRHLVDRNQVVYDYRVRERLAAGIALGAGFISAFFGIGGGIINVPVMMLVLKMPANISVATSQLSLMIASLAAVLVHIVITFGEWDPMIRGLFVGLGTLVGAQIGVYLANRVSARVVLLVIAATLLLTGARQIFAGL